MIFTTNKSPKRWGEALHDEDLAEAIVDRILERGPLLRLDGPSIRTKHLATDDLADDEVAGGLKISGESGSEFPERTEENPIRSLGLADRASIRASAA
jgi:hypothetical protein